ncbi:hypothetical protein AB4Z54_12330, partial [Streptomyces sp. MCAF7]
RRSGPVSRLLKPHLLRHHHRGPPGRHQRQADGLVPYLDYSSPTFFDTITAALQGVISGKTSPEKFATTLQQDYGAFMKKQRERHAATPAPAEPK